MKTIDGDILEISGGIICQQVNCAGGYGAGLSGRISKRHPQVERAYRKICKETQQEELFGICQPIRIDDHLTIVNIFSEWDYANSYGQGNVSTDMGSSQDCSVYARDMRDKTSNVPYRIGCGLAGGDWEELCRRCADLPLIVVRSHWAT